MDNRALSPSLRVSRDVGTGIVWVKVGFLPFSVHVSEILTKICCGEGGVSSCGGSFLGCWTVSDIAIVLWGDIAIPMTGRGRNTIMVEFSCVIHSSLSSWDREISLPVNSFSWISIHLVGYHGKVIGPVSHTELLGCSPNV